ncbi:MAG: heme lyase CcmF/NrfE family subunit, partial [Thermocrispum sp.]
NSIVGLAGVLLGLLSAATLAVSGVLAARGDRRGARWARQASLGVLLGGGIAMLALEVALVTDDFSVRYVAENHARSTPLLFTIATAWAALEGSIVLWCLVLAGYTAAVARRVTTDDRLGWAALAVLGIIAVFFFGLVAIAANPFELLANPPADGPGPNPLLANHILMAVHPPLLYLGYVGFSVPFAFGMAALARGDAGAAWLARTRRWSLLAWTFLTAGVAVGALWSYEVLGWGGYWAWDPVENASLLPWLAATAFVHSAIAQARRGVLKAWNVGLLIATFTLTILGTFLTRSGVVASVHSFTQSAVGPALLGFLGVVLLASLGLFAARIHLVASAPRIDSLRSREGAFLVNNLLLTVLTFVVLLGTTYPILLEAVTGAQVSVGRPFFDRFAVPLGLALLVAVAIGPLLPYRAARPGLIWQRTRGPLLLGLAAGAVLVLAGVRVPSVVLAMVLATFVGASIGGELRRVVRTPPGSAASGALRTVRRNRGYWGGQLAHLGVAVVALAIAVTSGLGADTAVELRTGQSAPAVGYTLRYEGLVEREEPSRSVQAAVITVLDDAGREVATLQPRVNQFTGRGQAVGTPAVRTTWREDLYLALRGLDAEQVSLEVYRYPLMWLLWAGGALIVLGGVWALTGRRSRQRPSQPSPAPQSDIPEEVGASA